MSPLKLLIVVSILFMGSSNSIAQKNSSKEIMYAGTSSTRESKGIYVMEFDRSKGKLTPLQTVTEGKSPNFLAFHPNGKFLYAAYSEGTLENNVHKGSVVSFKINPATGFLTKLNELSSEGQGPAHISVDPQGRFAYVSNYGAGNLAVYSLNKDGSFGNVADVKQFEGSSVHPSRQKASHVHSIIPSPDGNFIYVSDLGTDKIMIYKVEKSGKLFPAAMPYASSTPGAGPRHFTFHPGGNLAFSVEELSSTVAAFRVNKKTGALTPVDRINMLPENFTEPNTAADIHVSPDGKFLYASNRGHQSIAIYSIDSGTGKLKFVGHENTLGDHPRNFLIDPKDEFVFVANMNTDNIVLFRRDKESGKLNPTGEQTIIPAVMCVLLRVGN